jgi:hypothetical protein
MPHSNLSRGIWPKFPEMIRFMLLTACNNKEIFKQKIYESFSPAVAVRKAARLLIGFYDTRVASSELRITPHSLHNSLCAWDL